MVTALQKTAKAICIAVLICLLVATLGSCDMIAGFLRELEAEPLTDEQLIEARIDDFAGAYNNGDYDGVLECLDTKTRNTFNAMMNVGEAILGGFGLDMGIGLSDLFSLGIGMIPDDEALTFAIHTIEVNDDNTATVNVNVKSAVGGFTEEGRFTMKKEDGDWYIRNLEFNNG